MTENFHAIPNNDSKPHTPTVSCKCKPRVETVENGNKAVIHNPYDGREFFEGIDWELQDESLTDHHH